MGFFGRTSSSSGRARPGILVLAAASALACHYFGDDFDTGDSGATFVTTSQFKGTWSGTLRQASDGSFHDLQVVFDDLSAVTSISFDGTVRPGFTGTLYFADTQFFDEFARFYDFEFTDGVTLERGSFYPEDRFKYGLLIYSNGDFAVLQKNAPSRPTFANADMANATYPRTFIVFVRWSDVSVIEEVGDATMATGAVSGTGTIPYSGMLGGDVVQPPGNVKKILVNGIPLAGDFTNFDPAGYWEGLDNPLDTHPMALIVSFNKEFAGAYECDPNGFPECVFLIWALKEPQPITPTP